MRERRSSVRVGTISMVMNRQEKVSLLYYDKLFDLCEHHLPTCRCDVVLLPECYCMRRDEQQPLTGALADRFGALARRHGLYLVAPFREKSSAGIYNTMAVVSPQGRVLFHHRKVHLPPNEDKELCPGDTFATCELPWFRTGIVTCYDNMFPESTRSLALQGAQVVLFPSFGMQRMPHRNAARCRDNHIYMVSAGVIDLSCSLPEEFFATGSIIDPCGEIVAEASAGQRMVAAELPLDSSTGKLAICIEENLLVRRRPEAYRALCP
jgi:predicted amidohydrolase